MWKLDCNKAVKPPWQTRPRYSSQPGSGRLSSFGKHFVSVLRSSRSTQNFKSGSGVLSSSSSSPSLTTLPSSNRTLSSHEILQSMIETQIKAVPPMPLTTKKSATSRPNPSSVSFQPRPSSSKKPIPEVQELFRTSKTSGSESPGNLEFRTFKKQVSVGPDLKQNTAPVTVNLAPAPAPVEILIRIHSPSNVNITTTATTEEGEKMNAINGSTVTVSIKEPETKAQTLLEDDKQKQEEMGSNQKKTEVIIDAKENATSLKEEDLFSQIRDSDRAMGMSETIENRGPSGISKDFNDDEKKSESEGDNDKDAGTSEAHDNDNPENDLGQAAPETNPDTFKDGNSEDEDAPQNSALLVPASASTTTDDKSDSESSVSSSGSQSGAIFDADNGFSSCPKQPSSTDPPSTAFVIRQSGTELNAPDLIQFSRVLSDTSTKMDALQNSAPLVPASASTATDDMSDSEPTSGSESQSDCIIFDDDSFPCPRQPSNSDLNGPSCNTLVIRPSNTDFNAPGLIQFRRNLSDSSTKILKRLAQDETTPTVAKRMRDD